MLNQSSDRIASSSCGSLEKHAALSNTVPSILSSFSLFTKFYVSSRVQHPPVEWNANIDSTIFWRDRHLDTLQFTVLKCVFTNNFQLISLSTYISSIHLSELPTSRIVRIALSRHPQSLQHRSRRHILPT